MMNRTIGSNSEQSTATPTSGTSTNASGSAGTTVTPAVSTSQPAVSTASAGSESEEVHSKLPVDTPTTESQSNNKDDQSVPMATEPPTEGSNSAVVPSTTSAPPSAPAEEQRRPRLTIRLVHRPRGAPRCKYYLMSTKMLEHWGVSLSQCLLTKTRCII